VFLLSLFTKFPLTSQLEACTRMLEFLSSLQYDSSDAAAKPARKTPKKAKLGTIFSNRLSLLLILLINPLICYFNNVFLILVKSKNSISDGLFDTTLRTPKQLRHFTYESSAFIVSLLSSSAFVEQVYFQVLILLFFCY